MEKAWQEGNTPSLLSDQPPSKNSRRTFLRDCIGGIIAGTAVRTWPFRVYSFPTDIVIPPLSALPLRALPLQEFLDRYVITAVHGMLLNGVCTSNLNIGDVITIAGCSPSRITRLPVDSRQPV